jgi:glycosyltransferase involved in cell wall biosynthesis
LERFSGNDRFYSYMRILIATGIYPPAIGGPAQFAFNLKASLEKAGHTVDILTYKTLEHILPFGLRHVLVFVRALFRMPATDLLIALDTVSAGLPATLAARTMGVPAIARIGGDFLWETFVERTHEALVLPSFYEVATTRFSMKERMIFQAQRLFLSLVDIVAFTTAWQQDLWSKAYGVSGKKCRIVENAYSLVLDSTREVKTSSDEEKTFLWGGRPVVLKNIPLLTEVFKELRHEGYAVRLECVTGVSHKELMESVSACYATILPSYSDVSPNFVSDGLRLGKPYIMTRHTGISDRVKGAGILIDPLDKADIKRAVIALLDTKTYDACTSAIRDLSFVRTYDDIAKDFLGLI